ncbi:MAG TPA: NADH-quinone oxidoreductase subunit C [Chromatiales bacterium]|jgi:NADH-quinone oxidoreductase subunit C|nr:NADH-quinone oxidoreductase subunit C [Chromatiaceae bacterium]HIN81506.1 NADH-quinone oxidoreductase subunit C [Chromatiales bacterium]HIO53880.1 NADH-quinone oxidoreductase subunit C [Chromatiales bacterium]
MTDEVTQTESPTRAERLAVDLRSHFGDRLQACQVAFGEVTITVAPENVHAVCEVLIAEDNFGFTQLTDISGLDYLTYGQSEWDTNGSQSGFGRGVAVAATSDQPGGHPSRFAVAYQLISMSTNRRLRIRAYLDSDVPMVQSVADIYPSANWAEREAFDLFGILFSGHPDLRRILTDYGFIGHPFRKDFPLTGHVEVRYDPEKGRVEYVPTEIEPRTLVPRVIRAEAEAEPVAASPNSNEEASDA